MTPLESKLLALVAGATELLENCRPTHFDFSGALVHHEKPSGNELQFDPSCPKCVIPKAIALLREALLAERQPVVMNRKEATQIAKDSYHEFCRESETLDGDESAWVNVVSRLILAERDALAERQPAKDSPMEQQLSSELGNADARGHASPARPGEESTGETPDRPSPESLPRLAELAERRERATQWAKRTGQAPGEPHYVRAYIAGYFNHPQTSLIGLEGVIIEQFEAVVLRVAPSKSVGDCLREHARNCSDCMNGRDCEEFNRLRSTAAAPSSGTGEKKCTPDQ